MTDSSFKLDELARASGTSARTIRYYVQRGLLASPAFRGKDTAYDASHLVRLRAIRRLQDAFFPLDAIAAELARLDEVALERLADGRDPIPNASAWAPTREPEPEPARAPAPTMSRHASRMLREVVLAEGVTLLVDDAAPPASRRLVETILATISATSRLHEGP